MTTATLDLMTLNTWGFRWPLARHRAQRFDRLQRHLAEDRYDVVLLQELWAGAKAALGETGMVWTGEDAQTRRGVRMVESGLGIAAGAHIASLFDHVDLDGNLLIAQDPWPGVDFADGVQVPAERPGLGVAPAPS